MHDENVDTLLCGVCNLNGQPLQPIGLNGGQPRLFGDQATSKFQHNCGGHGGSTAFRFKRVPRED